MDILDRILLFYISKAAVKFYTFFPSSRGVVEVMEIATAARGDIVFSKK